MAVDTADKRGARHRWPAILLMVFALCYGAALLLLLVGTFGWFGQPRDPLSGVFLIPLGMPWVLLTGGLPDAVRPWAAAASPLLNLALLGLLARRLR